MSGSRTVILKPKPRGTSTVKEFRVSERTKLNICKESLLSCYCCGYLLVLKDEVQALIQHYLQHYTIYVTQLYQSYALEDAFKWLILNL